MCKYVVALKVDGTFIRHQIAYGIECPGTHREPLLDDGDLDA